MGISWSAQVEITWLNIYLVRDAFDCWVLFPDPALELTIFRSPHGRLRVVLHVVCIVQRRCLRGWDGSAVRVLFRFGLVLSRLTVHHERWWGVVISNLTNDFGAEGRLRAWTSLEGKLCS